MPNDYDFEKESLDELAGKVQKLLNESGFGSDSFNSESYSDSLDLKSYSGSLDSKFNSDKFSDTEGSIGLDSIDFQSIESDSGSAYGIVTVGVEKLEINDYGASIVGFISSEKRSLIRLGSYISVPYFDDESLFGKISKIEYRQEYFSDDATEIHSNRVIFGSGINRTNEFDYKFLIYIEPICILYKNKDGVLQRRMADRIPKPNSPIYPVSDKAMIQTGLNIPSAGVFLGHLSVGGEIVKTNNVPPTVPYYLRNDYSIGDPLIFRHVLVCGSTGTGKTFLTKNILRQFMEEDNTYPLRKDKSIKKKPCLVIMDPQDEYCQMIEDNELLDSHKKFNFDSENISYGGFKDTFTFLTKVSGQEYTGRSKAVQKSFTIPFSYIKSNPWIMETAELSEPQKLGLEKLIEDYFEYERKINGIPKYKSFKEFVENPVRKQGYVEEGKIHESSYDAILRKVLISDFDKFFDQSAQPIEEIFESVFKPGQISVFPTEYISSPRIRDLIVLTIMSIIVDNKLSTSGNETIKDTPVILALDEAHRYLSKDGGSVQSERIIHKFAEAVKQGRKEGLGLFLITQDPQDIQPEILKQVNTKIILNLNNDAAINSVKVPKEYEKKIPYLKKGQMIIYSPDNSDIVEITGLSDCVVNHK